ncbi:MAG: type II toxin-antitoxin system death-on-curing family toxin [Rhodospirillales bacterium]|jgi:death-on-curing protein|nr:type II toxin-antitoxin system death-on-curing family toxin [Rhodospirillales bacterium]MDP7216147.1 type II toxin-antitoxin system death-on-curing family toxin [Rhodospirillales bacterium]HJO74463.1 type II toxin-antitoxin system death-on-curing family toxin [Rhodospirillales bacterium]
MTAPSWVRKSVVRAIHHRQLAEHGGEQGLRDEGLLRSALARPQNLYAYGDTPPSIVALAASYGYGIVQNHPFVDGNKRTAYVTAVLFPHMNGFCLMASPEDKYRTFMALADGALTEDSLVSWFEEHLARIS